MLRKSVIATLLVGLSSIAFAGPWTVKIGGSYVDITGESDLADGAVQNAKATNEFSLTPSIEYRFGNTPFSAELLLATPLSHDIKRDGGGKIASLKELPPTLTAKYHLPSYRGFSPYIGAGVIAFIPWDVKSKGTLSAYDVDADTAFGAAGQLGFIFQPKGAKSWGIYGDVRYADLKTEVTLNGNDVGNLDLDPLVYTLGYSYTF